MNVNIKLLLLLFCSCGVTNATSPPPIDLRSDRLDIDIEGGRQVFSGNVSLVQGGLSIDADEIEVKLLNGVISGLSASGSPLQLKNVSDALQPMRAQANLINYETRKWMLVLSGDVKLNKPGWEASSHVASYHLRTQVVSLTGSDEQQVQIHFSAPLTASRR